MDSAQLHFLLFPFPAPGHLNPFFYLSTQLHSLGVTITFVTTSVFLDSLLDSRTLSAQSNIRFVTIPPLPPEILPPNVLLHALEKHQGMLEDLIASSRSTSSPISCLITDPLCPWTQKFADKVGVPRALLWTSAARFLQLGLLAASDQDSQEESETILKQHGTIDEIKKLLSLALDGIENTACVLVNSFDVIEPVPIASSIATLDIKLIGPLVPPVVFCEEIEGGDSSCLSWLNKHDPCSVLYISFGSIFDLPQPQLEQFMLGVESSDQPFIWVRRLDQTQLSGDFLERTGDRGLVIPWAPQLDILRHPAIAGFVTHCGWNSVVESVLSGVPMLCFPIMVDQHMNADMVAREWQVGVEPKWGERGVVEAEEVERAIKALIGGEGGVQRRVKEMAGAFRARMNGGYFPSKILHEFVEGIRCTKRENAAFFLE